MRPAIREPIGIRIIRDRIELAITLVGYIPLLMGLALCVRHAFVVQLIGGNLQTRVPQAADCVTTLA